MGFSSGLSPWNNAAPNAHELASARRVYGLPGSACRKTGAVVKALFECLLLGGSPVPGGVLFGLDETVGLVALSGKRRSGMGVVDDQANLP
ncbi:hypothetical protein MTP99_007011 [Tenebrio molitor]|jgi:hypothetical protein|nr:hypothetical protein MTP99_007011 [Tenebrio molitor]